MVLKGSLRKFGLDFIGDISWGTHICQLYETKQDLLDIMVPYFAEGLRNNEACIWATLPPLEVKEAKAALRKAVPDLDKYIKKGQVGIYLYPEDFLTGEKLDKNRIFQILVEQEKNALDKGFTGLRVSGDHFWVDKKLWKSVTDYEAFVNKAITSHRVIVLCAYSLEKCTGTQLVDIMRNHVGALIVKDKEWRLVEDIGQRRKTEELYRNVIQTSIDSFWINDTEGRFLDVNAAYCKLTGYSRSELLKMRIQDVEVKESAKQVLKHIQKIKRQGRDRFEAQHRRKNGQVVDIEVSAKYMGDDNGRIFVFAHDITRRKRNEQAIKQNEARYRELANSITDPFFALDSDLRYTYWNKASELLTGIKAKAAIGKHVFDLFSNNKATRRAVKVYKKVIRTKKPQVFVNEYLMGDRTVFFEIHAYPTKDGISVFSRDITERKKAEAALRESQLDLNRAQAVAKTGSWRLDAQRNELLWSDEAYRIFGIPKGTLLTYETFIECVHPKDRDYVDMKWQAALRGEPYDIEHRIISNGEGKWVREKAEMEFDENGTSRGGFGTVQEITEIVEMREKLEHYSRHLEDLVEEKTQQLKNAERLAAIGETAGMIGHDIRNPLQAIIGELYLSKDCLQSLPEHAAKQELKDSMRVIEEQTFYIDKIVTDLQDYARPLAPHVEEVDLESIVDAVLSTVDIPENIQVAYLIEKDYPNLMIDSSYMKRILTNLINNAVQAMLNGGKLTINAYCKKHHVYISVEDTGGGIPEEAKNKIFKPLFTTKAKGQGFGLPVAKKLVDALNATITFESAKGKGTKFIIQFSQNSKKNKS
jgi:PAS domain S-box-containing protein